MRHKSREGREETEAEEDEEGSEVEGDRNIDTPREASVEVTCVGGDVPPPPQRKTRTSQDSTQNVRTCCCRKSMETSRITMTGRNWTGESRTTLYGSVVGASMLRNQRAGTPRLRSGGAPIHRNLGHGLAGGSRQELELR